MKHAAATLGSGNLRLAVMLPEGEDLNEWVAVNSKSKHHPFDAVLEASFHSKIKIEASCFSCSC
jgi:hypothetical protein